jgi:hypothetical protein
MTILPGYLDTPDERAKLLETVKRQHVLFMIVTSRSKDAVWSAYPDLASYIDTDFAPLAMYRIGEDRSVVVDVRVNRTMPTTGVDAKTGWPCFR